MAVGVRIKKYTTERISPLLTRPIISPKASHKWEIQRARGFTKIAIKRLITAMPTEWGRLKKYPKARATRAKTSIVSVDFSSFNFITVILKKCVDKRGDCSATGEKYQSSHHK